MYSAIYVQDEQINGMNSAAFASFIAYSSAVVFRDKSLILEGFDKSLNDTDYLDLREDLEIHFNRRLDIIRQYVLKSKSLYSYVVILYSDDRLEIRHLNGLSDLFFKILNYNNSWGVFSITKG